VRLASRGLRDMGGTMEPITDADELAAVRRQALRVTLKAFAASASVAIGLWVIG
jgi:hypothetical protein